MIASRSRRDALLQPITRVDCNVRDFVADVTLFSSAWSPSEANNLSLEKRANRLLSPRPRASVTHFLKDGKSSLSFVRQTVCPTTAEAAAMQKTDEQIHVAPTTSALEFIYESQTHIELF